MAKRFSVNHWSRLAASIAAGTAILSVSAQPRSASPAWDQITLPTARQVAASWNDAPALDGPEPYYGLNGKVTIEQVKRDLDTLYDLGFRAVTIQAGYDMPFAYLSPEYFAFFREFVNEAKKRGMCVWIVDDAGYPSGFAGGKFTTDKPALRMQALEIAKTIPVHGSASIDLPIERDVVSAAAVNQAGEALPLPLDGDHLRWTAPPGEWTILLADHEFRTSPTRSDTNPRRVKDGSQSLEDYLDPAATEQFLQFTHEQYKRYVGDEFGKTILGFRGDEPDYSISGLPWTPAFFQRFQKIKGYDVQPFVALFAQTPSKRNPGVPIHLTPQQLRIRADYYDVFSQLFAEGFFKPQSDWCAANRLEYQVHLNHEEMEMDLTRSEGSFFRDMRNVQVPGIDAIWHQIWTDTISDYPRLASSVSHVSGRARAFTESFAAYHPTPDVKMARYILNEQFVRGINLVEMMYFPATSAGPRPAPAYMGEPGFADLAAYVRRMSYVMSMGRPDASIALYLPSSSMWLGDATADEQFVSTERLLSERQIDFDIVDEDALSRDLVSGHGSFTTASGNQYHAVILPGTEIISQRMLERLRQFAQGGGQVLFLGGTPKWIAGSTFRDARSASPHDFAWAQSVDETLPSTPTPGQFPPAAAPEAMPVPATIARALDTTVGQPTVTTGDPDLALRVVKRRWKDADVYLLFEEGAQAKHHTITLPRPARTVEQWNPQTGEIHSLPTQSESGSVRFQISLEPYGTSLLVVR